MISGVVAAPLRPSAGSIGGGADIFPAQPTGGSSAASTIQGSAAMAGRWQPAKEMKLGATIAWAPTDKMDPAAPLFLAMGSTSKTRPATLTLASPATSNPMDTNFGSQCVVELPTSRSSGASSPVTVLDWAMDSNSNDYPLGLIATGHLSGGLNLINAKTLLDPWLNLDSSSSDTATSSNASYQLDPNVIVSYDMSNLSGASEITGCSFHNKESGLFAFGNANGELRVVNYKTGTMEILEQPELLKRRITAVEWNQQITNVVAVGHSQSYEPDPSAASAVIWSVKQKHITVKLVDQGRRSPSSITWLPQHGTCLMIAYDDDQMPSVQLWDLRYPSCPYRELTNGHTRGITQLCIHPGDSRLAVSAGRDGRIATWDLSSRFDSTMAELSTQEVISQACFAPSVPSGLLAISTAQTTEKIMITNCHVNNNCGTGDSNGQMSLIPKWIPRTDPVEYAFGGKLLWAYEPGNAASSSTQTSTAGATANGDPQMSNVIVATVQKDSAFIEDAKEFDLLLQHQNFDVYIDSRVEQAEAANDTHSLMIWQVIKGGLMPMEKRVEHLKKLLGVNQSLQDDLATYLGHAPHSLLVKPTVQYGAQGSALNNENTLASSNETLPAAALGAIAADFAHQPLSEQETENFFQVLDDYSSNETNKATATAATDSATASVTTIGSATLDSRGPRASGAGPQQSAGPLSGAGPCQAATRDWKLEENSLMKQAALSGDRISAAEVAFKGQRIAEALIFAHYSNDPEVWKAAVAEFKSVHKQDLVLQLLCDSAMRDFDAIATTCDLSLWKEAVYTFLCEEHDSNYQSFKNHCSILARRLESGSSDIRSAVLCFALGGDFSGALSIWNGMSLASANPKKRLQKLVEQATVWRIATGFQGPDNLFERLITEYAELLSSSGCLLPAMRILQLVPTSRETRYAAQAAALRSNIYQTCRVELEEAGLATQQVTQAPRNALRPAPSLAAKERQQAQRQQQQQQQQQQYGQTQTGISQMGKANAWQQAQPRSMGMMGSQPVAPAMGHPMGVPQMGVPQMGLAPPATMPQMGTTQMGMAPPPPPMSVAPPPALQQLQQVPKPPQPQTQQFDPYAKFQQQQQPPNMYNQLPTAPTTAPYGMMPPPPTPQAAAAPLVSPNTLRPFPQAPQIVPQPPRIVPEQVPQQLPQQQQQHPVMTGPATGSTAPAASARPLPGMPMPWPIPTPVQQLRSTTAATEQMNRSVQQNVAESTSQQLAGNPCPPQSFEIIQEMAQKLLAAKDRLNDPHPERLTAAIQELLTQLSQNQVPTDVQSKLLELAANLNNPPAATSIINYLQQNAWNRNSKNWLNAIKRLSPVFLRGNLQKQEIM